ncbi:MAG: hypothetical protein WEE36_02425 [Acidimicrobiia bacterium]
MLLMLGCAPGDPEPEPATRSDPDWLCSDYAYYVDTLMWGLVEATDDGEITVSQRNSTFRDAERTLRDEGCYQFSDFPWDRYR